MFTFFVLKKGVPFLKDLCVSFNNNDKNFANKCHSVHDCSSCNNSSRNSKAIGMKTGRERIDVSTEIAHSLPAVGEKKNQHELPHINDVTKAISFRKERYVNRGAANETAMRSKYDRRIRLLRHLNGP